LAAGGGGDVNVVDEEWYMPNNVLFLLVFEEFLHWPQKGKEFKCDDTLLVNKGFQVFCM